ncbi:MAG: GlsB/YeaQ/YmgE family stress response membrane protein, partial [Hyphomicrobiaceae bacterium]
TGLVAGYLASFIVGPSGWGLLGYLVSGVIGAFVGGWLLKTAGINLGIKNEVASLIATSTIGAIVVVIVARLIA